MAYNDDLIAEFSSQHFEDARLRLLVDNKGLSLTIADVAELLECAPTKLMSGF